MSRSRSSTRRSLSKENRDLRKKLQRERDRADRKTTRSPPSFRSRSLSRHSRHREGRSSSKATSCSDTFSRHRSASRQRKRHSPRGVSLRRDSRNSSRSVRENCSPSVAISLCSRISSSFVSSAATGTEFVADKPNGRYTRGAA